MPLVGINRPSEENLNIPRDGLRVAQQVNDNIDRVNQAFAKASWTAAHGVEYLVPNPFGASSGVYPYAVLSHRAFTDAGVAQPIASISIGAPRLDGYIGITVQYAPPYGGASRIQGVAQSFVSSAGTVVLYDTAVYSYGSAITYAPGAFTVTQAGFYEIYHKMQWDAAAYTQFRTQINVNGASLTGASKIWDGAFPSYTPIDGSCLLSCRAGDIVQVLATQTNAAVVSRTPFVADSRFAPYVSIKAIAPDPATTANVTAVFIAGS